MKRLPPQIRPCVATQSTESRNESTPFSHDGKYETTTLNYPMSVFTVENKVWLVNEVLLTHNSLLQQEALMSFLLALISMDVLNRCHSSWDKKLLVLGHNSKC